VLFAFATSPHPGFIRFGHIGSKGKPQGFLPAVCRISHGKRRVAPLRCPVYAVFKALPKTWSIIPFTLIDVHSLLTTDLTFCA
jgi:hypothetical protein